MRVFKLIAVVAGASLIATSTATIGVVVAHYGSRSMDAFFRRMSTL